jgi:hypothetical protein
VLTPACICDWLLMLLLIFNQDAKVFIKKWCDSVRVGLTKLVFARTAILHDKNCHCERPFQDYF